LEASDQALYAAKRGGRNQVMCFCNLKLQPA
jgi:PleD family two-component response regulator